MNPAPKTFDRLLEEARVRLAAEGLYPPPWAEQPARFHEARADRAEKALDAYQTALGEAGPHDSERIRDLIQDMLHWLARAQYHDPTATLEEAVRDAVNDFPKELEEEEAHV
jgi:hypothetical protein